MQLDRRNFLATVAGSLALPAITGRASAATSLVVASLLGEDKPETLVWTFIRDRLEETLPGAFRFNIVPNAALGGEKAVIEGLRLGSVQASLATLSALSVWVPESQVFDLPFLFRDGDHMQASLDGSHGRALADRLAGERLIAPAFIRYGARHLLAREPLPHPEQMQGKRIRVIQSPLHAQLWESFGARPVALPITETYNALSTGLVDAMDLTLSAYAGFKLYEVVPHVTLTGHIHAAGALLFSGSFWAGLSAEQQQALADAARAGALHFNALMAEDERRSIAEAEAASAVLHQVTDRAAWEAPARAVWENFAAEVGGMERILALASGDH